MNLPMYSAAGDIITVMLCIVCWLFLRTTYTTKQTNLKLFYIANTSLCISAISHSFLNYLLNDMQPWEIKYIYILHAVMHICLALVLLLYCLYLGNLFELSKKSMRKLYIITIPAFIIFTLYKIIACIYHIGFYIDANFAVHYNYMFNAFICYYLYMCSIVVGIIYMMKKRLITKTRKGLQSIVFMSFLVMFLGHTSNSASFICVSFMFPIIAVLFFFHYNAYDTKTGTLDFKSFGNYIKDLKEKPFGIFYLYLKNFSMESNPNVSEKFVQFTEHIFDEYGMFRMSDERIILVYKKKNNSSDENLIKNVMENFNELYTQFEIPFKLVYIRSNKNLENGDDYVRLGNMIMGRMELNTFYKCQDKDMNHFIETNSIKDTLFDIYVSNNLDDPRVKVYCQPILDVVTNTYKKAEVLMRIESNGVMIMPEDFIPIAEAYGYIHILSKIILNKTCKCINDLIEEGCDFDRISINFSTIDFKDKDFYKEILHIIEINQTPADKIAIEITETETEDEAEYKTINRAIKKLKDKGIVFYLDDFGTGYSNFQRTFTLPVDVIKFDRSLTALACKNPETYSIVKKFSNLLVSFGYKILFEGVESQEEELRCKEMNPHYLQGYNYSEPIEIDNLVNYFKTY